MTKTAAIHLVHTPSSTAAIVVARNGRTVGQADPCPRGFDAAATILGIELAESLGYCPDVTREDVRAAQAGATVEATIAARTPVTPPPPKARMAPSVEETIAARTAPVLRGRVQ